MVLSVGDWLGAAILSSYTVYHFPLFKKSILPPPPPPPFLLFYMRLV